MKQVFLYKTTAKLEDGDLAALREADFIPIQVASFDDVKLVDPLMEGDRTAVWMAAIDAMNEHDQNRGPGVKTLFGKKLLEKLKNCDVAAR